MHPRPASLGFAFAATLAGMASCRFDDLRRDFPAEHEAMEPLRERVGTFSNLSRRVKWVIHSPGELALMPVDVGPIDFEREMVVLVGMGPTPSPDYAVRLKRLVRDAGVLRAEIEYLYPPDGAAGSASPASPYHAVVMPRSDLRIEGFTAPE